MFHREKKITCMVSSLILLYVSVSIPADNGYYFTYGKQLREKRDTAVSLIQGGGSDGASDGSAGGRRKKDPVLLLPWWKEILGTIIFCIVATTYIVRKFFHPPTPVAYARVGQPTSNTGLGKLWPRGHYVVYWAGLF